MTLEEIREALRILRANSYASMQEVRAMLERAVERLEAQRHE